MKKWLVFIAAICLAQVAGAATITVQQAGGADHTTLATALAAASSGDVIEILDSSNYNEALPIPLNTGLGGAILDSLTIQAAAGAAPTIANSAGGAITFGPGSATTTVTGPFRISGSSNVQRLRVELGAGSVTSGLNALSMHAIILENIDYVKTGGGAFFNVNNDGPLTITNSQMVTGPASTGGAGFVLGRAGAVKTVTITNVDASQAWTAAQLNYQGGNITFNNCILTPPPTRVYGFMVGTVNSKGILTFNDCTLSSAGTGSASGTVMFGANTTGKDGNVQIIMNRPTFGPFSTVAARITGDVKLSINGTPTAKVDLNPFSLYANSNYIFSSGEGTLTGPNGGQAGSYSITDCSLTRRMAMGMSRAMGTTTSPAINIDRCFFAGAGHPAGMINVTAGVATNLTMTNTIWIGQGAAPLTSEARAVTVGSTTNAVLTHCTFVGGLPEDSTQACRFFVGAALALTANYCIFNDQYMGVGAASTGLASLSGEKSIVTAGTFPNAEPASWLVGEINIGTIYNPVDPLLEADGRLTDKDSPAVNQTPFSIEGPFIDIDGNPRPLTGRDLGASQTPIVNSVSDWGQFE